MTTRTGRHITTRFDLQDQAAQDAEYATIARNLRRSIAVALILILALFGLATIALVLTGGAF